MVSGYSSRAPEKASVICAGFGLLHVCRQVDGAEGATVFLREAVDKCGTFFDPLGPRVY